jgi:hypothetical protein
MTRNMFVVLYIVVMIAVVVSVDLLFLPFRYASGEPAAHVLR